MTSIREQQYSHTTPLTPSTLPDLPSKKSEPEDSDFAELDALIAAASKTTKQQRQKAGVKKLTEELKKCRAQSYKLVDCVQVWSATRCECGYETDLFFVRFMEKWQIKEKSGTTTHWKTVDKITQPATPVRNAYTITHTKHCECCLEIAGKVESLKEVIG